MWDPDRVERVGSVMSRYSSLLQEGDKIRLGMEGEPLYPYGSLQEAPLATVTSINRNEDGMTFRAVLESSGEELTLNDHSINPRQIWEMDESSLPATSPSLEDRVRALEENMAASFKGTQDSELRTTLADSVRELAGDILRLYRGQPPKFVDAYVDRYDKATIVNGEESPKHEGSVASLQGGIRYQEFEDTSEKE